MTDQRPDPMARAARQESERERRCAEDPDPTLGAMLGQVGVLGGTIVMPILGALALGHWLDHRFGTGIVFSATALMIGAALGFMVAWRWMHRAP